MQSASVDELLGAMWTGNGSEFEMGILVLLHSSFPGGCIVALVTSQQSNTWRDLVSAPQVTWKERRYMYM